MTQILHVIDFEGTRRRGIREYGIVTLIDLEVVDTHFASCEGEMDKHIKFLIDLRRTGSFVGHNTSVEDRLLRHHACSPGYVKKFSGCENKVTTWGPWIDTKVLYKNFFRTINDFSLKHLIENFDLSSPLFSLASKVCSSEHVGYHNALFDALATCILLQKLIKILQDNNLAFSIEALIEYSQRSKLI